MYHFAVLGNPIAHSQSPQIHQAFASQFKLKISYEKILSPRAEFKKSLNTFLGQGGNGCNITTPFKQEAYTLCGELTKSARLAKAVNTIKITHHKLLGENTDGQGLINDLSHNLKISLANKTILILGAGGASRGIIAPLLHHNPKFLMIANRTKTKAQKLAQDFSHLGETCGFSLVQIKAKPVDIVINATTTSLSHNALKLPTQLIEGAFCYDLVYGGTTFIDWAKKNGAIDATDGFGMLVEQAALSFEYWLGKKPCTQPIINTLK